MDLVRFMRALRAKGIEWPDYMQGLPSFRLQDLTAINSIEDDQAHGAWAGVNANIDLARKVKKEQQQLFAYVLQCRSKLFVSRFLNVKIGTFFFTTLVICRLKIIIQL
ncbi:MAG: hypothetical protein CBC09_05275 [Cellvibrionales bacterium TMED49]|nr:hypothetical protein [Porticoccaceae bacterium]OUU38486.1 MAG: hypothetical protein CBC09_05275 [Cellvibrionales bacterium TMED49]|tara:strand:- start:882 stop:1205 length:324 start_codon:yes stop_codon:yes gene_type:complete